MTHSFRRRRLRTFATAALAGTVCAAAGAAHTEDPGLSRLSLEELEQPRNHLGLQARRAAVRRADLGLRRSPPTTSAAPAPPACPRRCAWRPTCTSRASAPAATPSARAASTARSANKLLVLIDGRSVYTPLFSGVFWDVQDVMLEDVERIEVISGPGGTLWGANAVNGVINVITRSAARHAGHAAWRPAPATATPRSPRATAPRSATAVATGCTPGTRAAEHTETQPAPPWTMPAHDTQAGFARRLGRRPRPLTVQGDAYSGRHGQPLPGTIAHRRRRSRWARSRLGRQPARPAGRAQLDGGAQRLGAGLLRPHRRATCRPPSARRCDIIDLQVQHAFRPRPRTHLVWGGQLPPRARPRSQQRDRGLPAGRRRPVAGPACSRRTRSRCAKSCGSRSAPASSATTTPATSSCRTRAWPGRPRPTSCCGPPRRAPCARRRAWTATPSCRAQPPFLLAGGPRVRSEIANVLRARLARPAARRTPPCRSPPFHADYDHLRTQQIDAGGTFLEFDNGMEGRVPRHRGLGHVAGRSPRWRLRAGFTRLWQPLQLEAGQQRLRSPCAIARRRQSGAPVACFARRSTSAARRAGLRPPRARRRRCPARACRPTRRWTCAWAGRCPATLELSLTRAQPVRPGARRIHRRRHAHRVRPRRVRRARRRASDRA